MFPARRRLIKPKRGSAPSLSMLSQEKPQTPREIHIDITRPERRRYTEPKSQKSTPPSRDHRKPKPIKTGDKKA
ncbi:hypothetical protein VTJ04DRAFT_7146 [Mycothermus thermophilus]|uniref:uncharacterized protein n=1 Tax=Humicola insolens TaxID=85995 RepID=UPI003742F657